MVEKGKTQTAVQGTASGRGNGAQLLWPSDNIRSRGVCSLYVGFRVPFVVHAQVPLYHALTPTRLWLIADVAFIMKPVPAKACRVLEYEETERL